MPYSRMGYDTMASWDRYTTFEMNERIQRQQVSALAPDFRMFVAGRQTLHSKKPSRAVSQNNSKSPSPIELPVPSFRSATSAWSPPPSPRSRSSTLSPPSPRSPRADSAHVLPSPTIAPMTMKDRNQLADKLYAAACAGDLDHIKLLLSMGAPINAGTLVEGLYEGFTRPKSGRLSALAGAARNAQMDAVELLLASGAEINPDVNQSSSSPLHQAVRADDAELARFLLELGADVNSLNGYKTTPLMYAVKYGSTDMVKLVLGYKPDMGQLSFIGAAAVHWAVWPNKPENLELLLAAGADANHPLGDGSTPLHCAASGGHLSTIECLLRRGADPGRRDDDWKTPLQIAEESGHMDIAKLLREAALRRRTV